MTLTAVPNPTPPSDLLSVGPTADRIVDGERWEIVLDLDPVARAIVTDLCHALTGTAHDLVMLSRLKTGDPEHARVLDRVLGAAQSRQVFQVPLHPDAAEQLETDLWEASFEPGMCEHGDCDNYTISASMVCDACDDGMAGMEPCS